MITLSAVRYFFLKIIKNSILISSEDFIKNNIRTQYISTIFTDAQLAQKEENDNYYFFKYRLVDMSGKKYGPPSKIQPTLPKPDMTLVYKSEYKTSVNKRVDLFMQGSLQFDDFMDQVYKLSIAICESLKRNEEISDAVALEKELYGEKKSKLEDISMSDTDPDEIEEASATQPYEQ